MWYPVVGDECDSHTDSSTPPHKGPRYRVVSGVEVPRSLLRDILRHMTMFTLKPHHSIYIYVYTS